MSGIANLDPYPAYKHSGVEWLGEVPEHWEVRPLKHAATLNPSRTESRNSLLPDTTVTFLPMERVRSDGRIDPEETSPASKVWNGFTYFRRDDVLVAKITPCFENGKGAHLHSLPTEIGFGSTEFHVLRAKPFVLPQFLYRLTTASEFRKLGTDAMRGAAGQQRVPSSFLANYSVPLPPLPEQTAIARVLDHADHRIRRYIRAKQKLMVLLEEQKRALIYQAVTGQIDVRTSRPYSAYKPSGVEWLGEVPEHWEVRRSKRTFTPRHELARPNDVQLSATQAYGVIAQEEYEKRVGRKVVKILRHLDQRRHVEVDDFVISMRSFQGGLERAWQSGCIRSSYIVLQAATELVVGYFGNLFKSVGYIAALQSTANFIRDGQDLNFENFCRVDLPFPPQEEQQLIAETLDRVTMGTESAIERSRREIALLREYHTRLIADVVTGKLDVREAAARLPEVDSLGDEDMVETVHTDVESNP